uniref:SFRICE_017646 n=1 Tax=Spodoptera frugiperda TaxID=7108 RepID=A0A2H1VYM8_SPOFR
MKILIFISLFVVFASASQELEVPIENNVAKKDDKTTNLLLTPPVDDVSKPPNVSIEPTTTKPLTSSTIPVTSTSPASTTAKAKGKTIRHRKPSHKRPRYRHKGSKDHMRPKPRLTKGPVDLRHRRPKYHHYTRQHRKPVYRVPKEIKPYNRHKRINRRRDNDYYY